MTSQEITERMRVLLDAALARHRGEITQDQYDRMMALGIDHPPRMTIPRASMSQVST